MIVLNENQLNKLNILTAQNNSAAKEVLKEADVKTLLTQNKNLNLSSLLNSLFKSVGNNNQANQTVLELLKKTNISKDMGSVSSNLQSLLKSLPNNETSKNLKSFLQNFLVNIDNSKNTDIKEQLEKSGIFLESKLAKNSSFLDDLKTILLKTKTQFQNLSNNPNIQNKEVLKNSISANETLKLTNKVLNQITSSENQNANGVKELLDKIKTNIQNISTFNNKTETLNSLDKLITKIPSNSNLNTAILNEVKSILTKVQNIIQNQIQQAQSLQIPKENLTNANETLKQIDKLLSQLNKSENIPNNEIKNLLNNVKTQVENLNTLISKSQIQNTQIQSSTSQLFALKAQLQNSTNQLTNPNEIIKKIDKIISKMDSVTPQETKVPFKIDSPIFNDIKNVLTKIQTQVQAQLQNQFQSQNIDEIKSQIQVLKENDPSDSLKQIDKLLNQIDYHQLYSLANSSSNIYIPFLWDLLEDGSIDIKKSDEDKFYCIIDLTLKELGNVSIHLHMFKEENLDISMFVENDETKQKIRQNLSNLKQAFFTLDLKVEAIGIYSKKSDESEKEDIYKQNDNFDFGLNIKV